MFDNTEIVEIMPGVMSTSLLYAHHRAVAKGVGFLAKRPPVLVGRLLRKMVPCFANVREKRESRVRLRYAGISLRSALPPRMGIDYSSAVTCSCPW